MNNCLLHFRRHPRGFATVLALILMGLVVSALAALALALSHDSRRSAAGLPEAQLRQLLLAGTEDVLNRSAEWTKPPAALNWEVPLPPGLAGAQVKVKIQPAKQGVTAVITASWLDRSIGQQLELSPAQGRWKLKQATLMK